MNAIFQGTLATINMTGQIFLFNSEHSEDRSDVENDTIHTRSFSSDDEQQRSDRSLNRQSGRKRSRTESRGHLHGGIFSFLFDDQISQDKPERGRSLLRDRTRGRPTNSARCENMTTLKHEQSTVSEPSLPIDIRTETPYHKGPHEAQTRAHVQKTKQATTFPMTPRWLRKWNRDNRKQKICYIEPVDTFDMDRELAGI